MAIKFENTNELFGDNTHFEADSKEALIEELKESGFFAETFSQSHARELGAELGADHTDEEQQDLISDMIENFRSGLVAVWTGEPRVIFDNAGGITLQLPGYAHAYDDAEQCASDIKDWLEDVDTSDWDGNEEDAVIDPTQEQIANGGRKIHSIDYFIHLSPAEVAADYSWGNIRDLYVELSKRIMED